MSFASSIAKPRDLSVSLRILGLNALLTALMMLWLFSLYRHYGNSPYAHLGTIIPKIALALWVTTTGAKAVFLSVTNARSWRKAGLHIPVGLCHTVLSLAVATQVFPALEYVGPFADHGVDVQRIAGTKHADANNGVNGRSLSISPDERWLTYWETHVDRRKDPKSKYPIDIRNEVCSIDLLNHSRVVHSVDSLTRENRMANWVTVGFFFDPAAWSDGRLFIDAIDYNLVLNPRRRQIARCRKLPSDRCGLDAPNIDAVKKALRQLHMSPQEYQLEGYSFADYQQNKRNHLYFGRYLPDEDVYVVMYHDGRGSRELLRKTGRLKLYEIRHVRVSPDGTFLAYSCFITGKAHVMYPDYGTNVYIRHLPSGTEKRVGRHFGVGNMIWSADSQRLYYAGSGFEVGFSGFYRRYRAGVYCVDVEATFPPDPYQRVPSIDDLVERWKQYSGMDSRLAFRYPDGSLALTDYGSEILLQRRDGVATGEDCAEGERGRPLRFYAQIQVAYRNYHLVYADLIPGPRKPVRLVRPATPAGKSPVPYRHFIPGKPTFGYEPNPKGDYKPPYESVPIRVGLFSGTRIKGPRACEYTYILDIGTDRSLVITRAANVSMVEESLAGVWRNPEHAALPRGEDPTFATILSTIEIDL